MDFDFTTATTNDLMEFARLNSEMADLLIARLEAAHPPHRMALFFPESTAPVADMIASLILTIYF